MTKKLVVGNMKMNLTLDEVKDYISKMQDYKDCVICPSYLYLPYFIDADFLVGAQNLSLYEKGAYTGEVSAIQAASIGVDYAIIGHSERRLFIHEDDLIVNAKVKRALSSKLKVILCVGETREEKNLGITKDKIEKQLLDDLVDIPKEDISDVLIAYEPIWAIGTGEVPLNEEIHDIVSFIKKTVKKEFHYTPKVLYGGSTNEKNIKELNTIDNVDGFLVGGACLVPDKFIKIIETVK